MSSHSEEFSSDLGNGAIGAKIDVSKAIQRSRTGSARLDISSGESLPLYCSLSLPKSTWPLHRADLIPYMKIRQATAC